MNATSSPTDSVPFCTIVPPMTSSAAWPSTPISSLPAP